MSASAGLQAYGIQVAYSSTSNGTFASFAELTDITPPSFDVDKIKISNNSSPTLNGRPVNEYLPGWVEAGQIQGKLVFSTAQYTTVFGLLAVPGFYKVSFPDGANGTLGSTLVVPGFLSNLGTPAPLDDKLEIDFTATLTGLPVFTAAS